jgi:hypothetical protein
VARFAKGDLVTMKPNKRHEFAFVLDLETMHNDLLPRGLPLLVLAVKPTGSGWNSIFVSPRYRAKVMDPSTGKMYASTVRHLEKMFKD